jgi:hypothetical protein
VTWKAIICVPLGHRWAEASDVSETYPVLRCRRCRRLRELTPETIGRLEARARATELGVDMNVTRRLP